MVLGPVKWAIETFGGKNLAKAIQEASQEVMEGRWEGFFPEEKLDFLLYPRRRTNGERAQEAYVY